MSDYNQNHGLAKYQTKTFLSLYIAQTFFLKHIYLLLILYYFGLMYKNTLFFLS